MSRGWDTISLDCHWRPREETPEQLARRLKELLCNLEALHPVFRQLQLYSRPTDQWEIPLGDSHSDASVLAQKFKKGVKRDKRGPEGVTRAFQLEASARSEDPPLVALYIVGGIGTIHSDRRRFLNQAALSMGLPATYRGEAVDRLVKPGLLAMVRAWQPDWASAYSTAFAQRSRGAGDPFPFYCGTRMTFLATAISTMLCRRRTLPWKSPAMAGVCLSP